MAGQHRHNTIENKVDLFIFWLVRHFPGLPKVREMESEAPIQKEALPAIPYHNSFTTKQLTTKHASRVESAEKLIISPGGNFPYIVRKAGGEQRLGPVCEDL